MSKGRWAKEPGQGNEGRDQGVGVHSFAKGAGAGASLLESQSFPGQVVHGVGSPVSRQFSLATGVGCFIEALLSGHPWLNRIERLTDRRRTLSNTVNQFGKQF